MGGMYSSREMVSTFPPVEHGPLPGSSIPGFLTLLTYPLLIFQQLCPFNRDKISSFLIRMLKFHDFYLGNTIYKMAWKKKK